MDGLRVINDSSAECANPLRYSRAFYTASKTGGSEFGFQTFRTLTFSYPGVSRTQGVSTLALTSTLTRPKL